MHPNSGEIVKSLWSCFRKATPWPEKNPAVNFLNFKVSSDVQRIEDHEDLDDVGLEPRPVADLVRAASDGETAAWRTLITRFGDVIVTVGKREGLPAPGVEELQQATWLRLVEGLAHIDRPDQLGTWLAATAYAESQRILKRDASL
jgi:hypothetical protein